jgi:hypothetical protein
LNFPHKTWLLGAVLLGTLSAAAATPPVIDARHGGQAALTIPDLPEGAQLALIPGGAYAKSAVALASPVLTVTIDGNHAYVASGADGMQVFELSLDAPPRLLAQFKGRGDITHVVLRDGYAYLTEGGGALLIVDVRDPAQPRPLARYPLPLPVDALCVEKSRVYWVGGKQFNILDATDPQKIRVLGSMALAAPVTALQVANSYAYLAEGQAGLAILDVRDPVHMREAGRMKGEVRDVAVADDRAYLANGATGLTILDIAAPEAPRWLGSINRIGTAQALSYSEGYLALENDRNELMFIDAKNPKLPKVLASHPSERAANGFAIAQKQVLAGTDAGLELIDFSAPVPNTVNIGVNYGGSRRAVIRDNILFVADWFSGLHLYDISDPAAPRHLANYHTQGSSKGVLVRGDNAFVADDDHGVQILDIRQPEQPRKISAVATPGLAYTMKLVGDYLYLADHRGGFHIISVADVNHPAIVGSAPTVGKAWAVDVAGSLAYVAADSAGLLVFDISDPTQPRQIAAYDTGGAAEDVVIRDHLAYVTSFDSGLHIFDISIPTAAREIGHLATPANARGIELVNDLAYIADWVSGIQIVNIANPAKPYTVGSYDTPGWSWGVRVKGRYAYVLDWWGGVVVLDVSDPANPTRAGAYHARGWTQDVMVRNDYAYVADGDNGLQIFDVKNPLNPIWMTGVDTAGEAQSVWLENNVAYLAAGTGGLLAVDVADPFQPKRLRHFAADTDLVRAHGKLLYAARRGQGVSVIDADTGHPYAQLVAAANDLWPAENRLLLATETGVEIFDLSKPQHPRRIKHLPHPATLVRVQGKLLVLYHPSTGFSFYDYATFKLLGRLNPGETITDMKLDGRRLYASGSRSGLLVLDVSNARRPALGAAYPDARHATRLSVFAGAVFMTGNETLSEVRLLQQAAIRRDKRGTVVVNAPPNLPPGSYHLMVLDPISGARSTLFDALRVELKPSGKPRFTLQDLERAMKARGLDPALHP